jgi:HSP20 family protein
MSISRFNNNNNSSQQPLRDLHRSIDRQFQQMFNDLDKPFAELRPGMSLIPSGDTMAGFTPNVDVTDTQDKLILHCELPGLSPEDVKVELKNNMLCLSGQKEQHKRQESDSRLVEERQFGSFCRSFALPANSTAQDIGATFNNGVLEVTVQKHEAPVPTSHRIEVNKGG